MFTISEPHPHYINDDQPAHRYRYALQSRDGSDIGTYRARNTFPHWLYTYALPFRQRHHLDEVEERVTCRAHGRASAAYGPSPVTIKTRTALPRPIVPTI